MPAELVIELADHPNLIGIKESSGDVEKVRKMVEGTRHVKRSATVTETFDAVTPRMLKATSRGNGQGGELVSVAALAEASKPSSSSVSVICGQSRLARKKSGSRCWSAPRRNSNHLCRPAPSGAILAFADAAPTACYEIYAAWKEGDVELARLEAGAHCQGRAANRGRVRHPRREVRYGFQRLLRRPGAAAAAAAYGRFKSEVERLLADIRN